MKTSDFACNGPTQIREAGAHPNDSRGWLAGHANGLTKRELFAAMAMQGRMACALDVGSFEQIAQDSASAADALITELNK